MRISYDSYSSLIFAHKDLTEQYFLSKSGVTGGYAETLFKRIYNGLVASNDDVKYLYDTYYAPEYTDFWDFLGAHYKLTREQVISIKQYMEDNPDYRIYDYYSLNGRLNFDDFICANEARYELFEKLLLMKL